MEELVETLAHKGSPTGRQRDIHLVDSFPGQPESADAPERLKTIWILMKQEMMGWQWHQLDHMQIICTSLQTDNHASISSLDLFAGRMLFRMSNQHCQSTEGKSKTHTMPANAG